MIGDGLSTLAGDVTNSADLDKLFATVLTVLTGRRLGNQPASTSTQTPSTPR